MAQPDRLHGDKTPEVDKELFARIFEIDIGYRDVATKMEQYK